MVGAFFFFFFFFFPVGRNSRVFKKAERRLASVLGPAISETIAGEDLRRLLLTAFHPPWTPGESTFLSFSLRPILSCPAHPWASCPPQLASSCSRDSQMYHHPWDTGRGGGGARLQGLGPVLVTTKLPEPAGLKQQKSILSQCWRLGVRNEGVCRAVLPPASASPSPAR